MAFNEYKLTGFRFTYLINSFYQEESVYFKIWDKECLCILQGA